MRAPPHLPFLRVQDHARVAPFEVARFRIRKQFLLQYPQRILNTPPGRNVALLASAERLLWRLTCRNDGPARPLLAVA